MTELKTESSNEDKPPKKPRKDSDSPFNIVKNLIIIVLVIYALQDILTTYIIGNNDRHSDSQITQDEKKEEKATKKKPKQEDSIKLNEKFNFYFFDYIVEDTSYTSELDKKYHVQKSDKNNEYYIVELTAKNTNTDADKPHFESFYLMHKDTKYDMNLNNYLNYNRSGYIMTEVKPKGIIRGKLIYEVPKGFHNNKDIYLKITNFLGLYERTIKLN